MLCTTQACGLGLNLTVADRVIIADPAWNALDEQVRLRLLLALIFYL